MNLNNKKILLTGAFGLLGRSHVRLLLEEGATIMATDLMVDDEMIDRKNLFTRQLDVGSEKAIEQFFSEVVDTREFVPNVIINNAAITGEHILRDNENFPDLKDTSLDLWRKNFQINLEGPFLIARAVDRRKDIFSEQSLKFINIASMYAFNAPDHRVYDEQPFNNLCAYSASKAGLHGLTKWLASYWAKEGITVNSLSPGAVSSTHNPQFVKAISQRIMLGRLAQPEDISKALSFLCSDYSSYMSGEALHVDGGLSAW